MSARRLADSWVDAGRRRIIVRALLAYGLTKAEVARMLGVSEAQVRRDLAGADFYTNPDGLPVWVVEVNTP